MRNCCREILRNWTIFLVCLVGAATFASVPSLDIAADGTKGVPRQKRKLGGRGSTKIYILGVHS